MAPNKKTKKRKSRHVVRQLQARVRELERSLSYSELALRMSEGHRYEIMRQLRGRSILIVEHEELGLDQMRQRILHRLTAKVLQFNGRSFVEVEKDLCVNLQVDRAELSLAKDELGLRQLVGHQLENAAANLGAALMKRKLKLGG